MKISADGQLNFFDFSEIGPADGLVAWYPLQGDTKDYASANDGTNNGAVPAARGYEFDGTDWINLGNTLYLPDNHPFTAAGWMRVDSFSSRDMLLSRNDAVRSGGPYTWLLGTRDGNRMYAYDGSSWSERFFSFSSGVWYHLCFSFNGSTMYYYVDGQSIGTTSWSFSDSTTGRNTQIGGYSGDTGNVVGGKADVRFYNRTLSAEEVAILYEITNPEINIQVKQTSDCVYVRGHLEET